MSTDSGSFSLCHALLGWAPADSTSPAFTTNSTPSAWLHHFLRTLDPKTHLQLTAACRSTRDITLQQASHLQVLLRPVGRRNIEKQLAALQRTTSLRPGQPLSVKVVQTHATFYDTLTLMEMLTLLAASVTELSFDFLLYDMEAKCHSLSAHTTRPMAELLASTFQLRSLQLAHLMQPLPDPTVLPHLTALHISDQAEPCAVPSLQPYLRQLMVLQLPHVITATEVLRSPAGKSAKLSQLQITHGDLTRNLVDTLCATDPTQRPSVQTLMLGGELRLAAESNPTGLTHDHTMRIWQIQRLVAPAGSLEAVLALPTTPEIEVSNLDVVAGSVQGLSGAAVLGRAGGCSIRADNITLSCSHDIPEADRPAALAALLQQAHCLFATVGTATTGRRWHLTNSWPADSATTQALMQFAVQAPGTTYAFVDLMEALTDVTLDWLLSVPCFTDVAIGSISPGLSDHSHRQCNWTGFRVADHLDAADLLKLPQPRGPARAVLTAHSLHATITPGQVASGYTRRLALRVAQFDSRPISERTITVAPGLAVEQQLQCMQAGMEVLHPGSQPWQHVTLAGFTASVGFMQQLAAITGLISLDLSEAQWTDDLDAATALGDHLPVTCEEVSLAHQPVTQQQAKTVLERVAERRRAAGKELLCSMCLLLEEGAGPRSLQSWIKIRNLHPYVWVE